MCALVPDSKPQHTILNSPTTPQVKLQTTVKARTFLSTTDPKHVCEATKKHLDKLPSMRTSCSFRSLSFVGYYSKKTCDSAPLRKHAHLRGVVARSNLLATLALLNLRGQPWWETDVPSIVWDIFVPST